MKFELPLFIAAHSVAAETHCCDLIQFLISCNSDILAGELYLSQFDTLTVSIEFSWAKHALLIRSDWNAPAKNLFIANVVFPEQEEFHNKHRSSRFVGFAFVTVPLLFSNEQ